MRWGPPAIAAAAAVLSSCAPSPPDPAGRDDRQREMPTVVVTVWLLDSSRYEVGDEPAVVPVPRDVPATSHSVCRGDHSLASLGPSTLTAVCPRDENALGSVIQEEARHALAQTPTTTER